MITKSSPAFRFGAAVIFFGLISISFVVVDSAEAASSHRPSRKQAHTRTRTLEPMASTAPNAEPLTWQKENAQGRLAYRKLRLNDFPVTDSEDFLNGYHIKTFIDPSWQTTYRKEHGLYYASVKDWKIFSGYDRSQSMRLRDPKRVKTSLRYVQALLDINERNARELGALKPNELPQGVGHDAREARVQLNNKLRALCSAKRQTVRDELQAFAQQTDSGTDLKKTRHFAALAHQRLAAAPSPAGEKSSGLSAIFSIFHRGSSAHGS